MLRIALFLILTGCTPAIVAEGEHVAEKAAEGFVEAENPSKQLILTSVPVPQK